MKPKRSTIQSAGYDIYSPVDVEVNPGEKVVIDTGVAFEDTDHVVGMTEWVFKIYPRSSLGFKYGMRFSNSVGIVDMDYRDTIKLSIEVTEPMHIKKGDRIAQGIFVSYGVLYDEDKPTEYRNGGIGSTGE